MIPVSFTLRRLEASPQNIFFSSGCEDFYDEKAKAQKVELASAVGTSVDSKVQLLAVMGIRFFHKKTDPYPYVMRF